MMKSFFDWRTTVLALVLAVAAALPSMTTSVVRRDYYFFDITLTSTAPGTTQLFWDLGRGYNENDSSRQPLKIERRPVVYRYMMPMGDFKALRFDPIDGVGVFYLSHARIVDYRGNVVCKFGPDDFKAFAQIARMERHGDTLRVETNADARDPILELEIPHPLHLATSQRIWLRLGLPVAVPVFILGLILGCPVLTPRLQRWFAVLGVWVRNRPRTTIALVATIAVAVQCHPVLFQGRSFVSPNNGSLMLYGELPTLPGATEYMYTDTMGSDTGALLFNHLYYPMLQHDALLKHGEWPLWNRNSLCGEPLLGQGQSMFGDPFNFLTILADGAAWAWDVRFLIAHWLFSAGLGFIVWRLTRHLAAALLVTLGSAFIAFYTYRLGHPANFSVCYSPWILWAWTGLVYASSPRRQAGWLAALVAANWLVFTSGTVKEAYMAMVCLNLAGAILLVLLPETRGRRWRLLVLGTIAGVIFILLSAPGWISFLVSLRHSYTGYDQPVAHPLPFGQIIGFFDDMFYRQGTVDETVLAPALNFFLLLGVGWWLVNPRLWRKDRAGLALLLGAVLPFVLAFGLVPAALVAKIPFIGNIHHTGDTFSCPLMVLAAVLAGFGFRDALKRLRTDGWWARLSLVFVLVAGFFAAFFLTTRGSATSPFFDGYAAALALGLVALPVGVRWAVQSSQPGLLWVALLIGLPLLLWRHCQYGQSFFNHYAFVPGLRCDLHAPSPGVAYVDQLPGDPGRVVGWGTTLFPSYNSALRWESLYGVDALRNRYYQEMAIEFGMQRVWVWDWFNKVEDAPRLIPAHDMMNVTHYVADPAKPPREYPGLQLLQQLDLDIYASPKAWPRAFFTDRLATYATALDFTKEVLKGDGRPFAARQDDQTDTPPLPAELDSRTVRAATDYRLTSNNTTFTIDAPGPGLAVLTETFYAEDFQVTVDGKPAPYFRVNHAFKGVAINSAGRHEITFAYWPQHFTLALRASAAGLLLLVVGFSWLWWLAPDPLAATDGGNP
jgi:hypothetical protein